MDMVMESVENPDYIVRGWTDELIGLKHYERTSISEKYMVVVYKEGKEGFSIRAFMTSKQEFVFLPQTFPFKLYESLITFSFCTG